MRQIYLLICFITIVLFSECIYRKDLQNEMISFDVSPNADSIIFSIKSDGITSIYISDINGEKIRSLIKSETSSNFFPRFNKSGDSIIFISTDYPKNYTSNLNIYDLRKQKDSLIYASSAFIIEGIFGNKPKQYYYLESNEYNNYSPIAKKASHGFDIYEYNSENKIKLSEYNAYNMRNIELFNDTLFFNGDLNNSNGIFLFDIKNKASERISVLNDTLLNSTWLTNLNLINSHTLICIQNYEILKIDLKQKLISKIKRSISGSHIAILRYNSKLNQIYFSEIKKNKIYVMDLNGKILRTIEIDI
ncbi:hypothetical protein [Flavobacterium sp. I3-2]|uniref:hypothetical protein n=1 Tax=Flavobacterium sp. I3-2 TaxID=2748319 RepID=UPI0015A8173B|nr:hypothetical protein [Flavobacterium sp. I3-2]